MIRNKRKSAERLFDVIGMIDDSIIAECQEPRASTSRKADISLRFRKYASVFVVLAVVCASISTGLVIMKFTSKKEDSVINDDNKGNVGTTQDTEYKDRFDTVLENAISSSGTRTLSLEEIDLFNGEINLIWTDASTDGYYVMTLNESSEYVKEGLKKGYSQLSADTGESENIGYTVWISYGNGEVVSPELKYSKGNIGYGELFEYSPEVLPSDAFVDMIEKNAK